MASQKRQRLETLDALTGWKPHRSGPFCMATVEDGESRWGCCRAAGHQGDHLAYWWDMNPQEFICGWDERGRIWKEDSKDGAEEG